LIEEIKAKAKGFAFDRNSLTDEQKKCIVWLCAGNDKTRGFSGNGDNQILCWKWWHSGLKLPWLRCCLPAENAEEETTTMVFWLVQLCMSCVIKTKSK
jgi:hypothetical protein